MPREREERRLAAVLAADMVGYSRLMQVDEEGIIARQRLHRSELIDPAIAEHDGRTVKTTGDGLLVEFSSVVDAVRCAVAIQRAMDKREAKVPEEQRIRYRVGINLGDIVVDGSDILGDGVNIAARIEAEAEPGGIYVSQEVYRQSKGKVPAAFEDLGERALKNISEPVRLFRVLITEDPRINAASAPPEVPSIAVLPFDNMSDDAGQSYLADGIAEDILTGLARVRWLVVTSRNSSFAYRGRLADLKHISSELGVRYVLEGSVRRAGDRVRVTAQLIDAVEDRHLWAERYDRRLEDIFDLQDEITATILGAIEPELGLAEQARARRKPPESLDAWDLYLRGQWLLFRYTCEDNVRAQDCFRRATALDPDFAASHAGLAYACHIAVIEGFSNDRATYIDEGVKAARRAVSLDDKDAHAYGVLARLLTMNREYDSALLAARKAVALNPNNAQVRFGHAFALTFSGELKEALLELDQVTRLSSRDPNLWSFMIMRAWALLALGRFEEAADWARRSAEQPNSVLWPAVTLVSSLGHLQRVDEARAVFKRLREVDPDRDLIAVWNILPFRDPAHHNLLVEGVRKAGVLDQDVKNR